MRFAMANNEKRQAEKGLVGTCVGCEHPVIPKCGQIKVNHWAHKSQCACDHWWENETEWHRSWKSHFPVECQEIRHRAENGEWHIADVKTKTGQILEFQHSFLKAEERLARNNFYGSNLVWVVDGVKRQNDLSKFNSFLRTSKLIHPRIQLILLSPYLEECPLLKEWSECNGPVFFDFGIQHPLWCLLPKGSKAGRYMGPFPRQTFIDLHNGDLTNNGQTFSELIAILTEIISMYENPLSPTIQNQNLSLARNRYFSKRQIVVPSYPSQRYLHYLNRSPRRRRR